jgi:chromosome segregation ATPase
MSKRIRDLEEKVSKLEEENATLKAQLTKAQDKLAWKRSKLRSSQQDLEELVKARIDEALRQEERTGNTDVLRTIVVTVKDGGTFNLYQDSPPNTPTKNKTIHQQVDKPSVSSFRLE